MVPWVWSRFSGTPRKAATLAPLTSIPRQPLHFFSNLLPVQSFFIILLIAQFLSFFYLVSVFRLAFCILHVFVWFLANPSVAFVHYQLIRPLTRFVTTTSLAQPSTFF